MIGSDIPNKDSKDFNFFGIYRAKVVEHNNDSKKDGSVKVRVYGVHSDDIPDEHLPWAIYADPFMGGLDFSSTGGALIPDKESLVWIMFQGGDHRYPVYFAGAPCIQDEVPDTPSESRRNDQEKEGEKYEFPLNGNSSFPFEEREDKDGTSEYPFNRVFRTKAGFIIEIDDTESHTRFRIKHPSGNESVADHSGNTEKVVKGNVNESFEKSYMRDVQTSVYENVGENTEREIGNNREETIGNNETREIGNNREETIGSSETRDIGANREEQIGSNETRKVGANETREIGANFQTEVGANYILEAGANIDITAGGIINIQAGGPCNIQAPIINLN